MEMDRKTKIELGCGNVSFLSLLGLAFVVLKLCGVISWSWWWVTAPFWAPAALALGIAALAVVVMAAIFACYAVMAK